MLAVPIAGIVIGVCLTRPINSVGTVHETTISASDGTMAWVTVINARSVRTGDNRFSNGQQCVVDYYGGSFSVGASPLPEGLVAITYRNPGRSKGFGTECGNGTIFAVNAKESEAIASRVNELDRARATDAMEFAESLRYDTGTPLGYMNFGWVKVANLEGVDKENGHNALYSHCTLEATRGPYTLLGVRGSDGAKLIRYDGKSGSLNQCGKGTLFLIDARSVPMD